MGVRLKVGVVGGGWAGFACAVELIDAGFSVTLFEAAPHLGGRARGFSRHGLQLDNGQHILLGAYRETLRLMRRVGVDPDDALLRLPLRLETPGHLRLATPRLPAPLHLLTGLLAASGLDMREAFAAAAFMIHLRLKGFKVKPNQTVSQLLAKQPEKLIRLLWEPLCLAALNTPITTADAQIFVNVLRDSLTRTRADSDLLLPRQDLGSLFPEAAAAFLKSHGSLVRHTMVNSITPATHQIFVDGEAFDMVVCATGPHSAVRLLKHFPEVSATEAQIGALTYQPITTVYMQYPSHIKLNFPMLGMAGEMGQWVFDRGTLCGQDGLLAVVISTEGPHTALDQGSLAAQIHTELHHMLGPLPAPEWNQVITEKRATFACTAGVDRPAYRTAHPRLWLAGDYTAGDYPATLEGAVLSGVQCAHQLTASLQ